MALEVDSFQVSGHLVHADDLVEGITHVEARHLNLKLLSDDVRHVLEVLQLEHAHLVAELDGLEKVGDHRAHLDFLN